MKHPEKHIETDSCCGSARCAAGSADAPVQTHTHAADETHSHSHEVSGSPWETYLPAIISFIMLMIGVVFDNIFSVGLFNRLRLYWYILAYLPVGIPVLKEAWETFKKKQFFTEFSLMSLATIGAFCIDKYPEGVAVMLFYSIGELFQMSAVNRARQSIKSLLDVRPDSANVLRNGHYITVPAQKVALDEIIQVRAGEKVPLDAELLAERGSFNTAALTGESRPKTILKGETVLAGMLNLNTVVELKVTKLYADSSISKILEMVQHATARKAKTELFIRRFAKVYTPIVFFLALSLVVIPFFIFRDYSFNTWLYRALVFLVISCPCALVISIPLGYFGGIGAASVNGILFKGSNFLEAITRLNTVVLDKTGTLTHGVFEVQKVESKIDRQEFLGFLIALEARSNHPIAKAIVAFCNHTPLPVAEHVEEIAGQGLKGMVSGSEVMAGNTRLFNKFGITYPAEIDDIAETVVLLAVSGQYAGYVLIADALKEDAETAVKSLHLNGIEQVMMLSGDKSSIVKKIAADLGIDIAYGDLLPEDKVSRLETIKADKSRVIAFVGDGINDTPVLALSDVGIAMGALGSDAAIETADVVIQTDQPGKIATAIKIGKATKMVVWQNIGLAFGVKALVLILGAGGMATMWEAVFADVGVALLAILNAVRIQKMRFD